MGKYMRKAKATGDVAVMEVPQTSIGVRTRAKTLALQRLQSSAAAVSAPPPPSGSDSCYLELRSRRLMKPLQQQNSRKARETCDCRGREDRETGDGGEFLPTGVSSGSIEAQNWGNEAFLGDDNLDCQAWERSTRESTPCSLIKASDTISTPVSTTKKTRSSAAGQRTRASVNVPTTRELEELFAREEQSQQLLFMEKYNFDIVNDLPLPGRYEWVKVRS